MRAFFPVRFRMETSVPLPMPKEMRNAGAQEGSTVRMDDMEFDFVE